MSGDPLGQVRLGRLKLRWCHTCNVPILDEDKCGTCGAQTAKVNLTPPGDIRPARRVDIQRIHRFADEQFGPGAGRALVPEEESVVVLNKAPAEDRMDEVIMDGAVIATMRYDPLTGWHLLPRLEAVNRMSKVATFGVVQISEDAVPFIEGGASVLAPGVEAASPTIGPEDQVMVIDHEGKAIAVGVARMPGKEMVEEDHGICVKIRHHRRKGDAITDPGPQGTWDDVITANEAHMERTIDKGKDFVHRVAEEEGLPVAVSFSGGKDSLAMLLVVLEAGLSPPVVFVDTGIELPETVEHVHDVAKRHDLELIIEESEHDFVEMSAVFGPPAKDYRWCCKTQKLGPVARALNDRFPGGMVTFIGQRRYESGPRSRSGAIWRNPWVPGQIGASPIQEWTAMHVWLYLMMRNEEPNPWYDLGLERIGCYTCPATDLADLKLTEEHYPGYARWRAFLEEWAKANGYDESWVDLGLWRFHKVPRNLQEMAPEAAGAAEGLAPTFQLTFEMDGLAEEVDGAYEARGSFDRELDLDRAAELLTILGETRLEEGSGRVVVGEGKVIAQRDGTIIARGETGKATGHLLDKARQLVVRAELCVGCRVCVPRCPTGALETVEKRVRVDKDECIHCGSCFGPCAVVDFPPVSVMMDDV
jgi:phosphoadenosine phosphosulfate reductase